MNTEALQITEPHTDGLSQMVRVGENYAVGQPLSISEITQRLTFIRTVMQDVMQDGQDFGKIPGCGDKPTLLQPGAQKLCLTFQLNTALLTEKVVDLPNYHREYAITVRVSSQGGKFADGVGVCSTLEAKYRYRSGERKCPSCGKATIITGKKEYGGGFICFTKKGGCGAKFSDNDKAITDQQTGRVEHDNPPDYWNTVSKMAFKRAFVHATINFTNTSQLWSQDLEDMPSCEDAPAAPPASRPPSQATQSVKTPPASTGAPKPPATAADVLPKAATEADRVNAVNKMSAVFGADEAWNFLISKGWVVNDWQDWKLELVPVGPGPLAKLMAEVEDFVKGTTLTDTPAEPDDLPPEIGNVVITVPRKGMKKQDYDKARDTIASLRNSGNEEDRKRLWGFVQNYQPLPREWKGQTYQPTAEDYAMREGLDRYAEFSERNDQKQFPATP